MRKRRGDGCGRQQKGGARAGGRRAKTHRRTVRGPHAALLTGCNLHVRQRLGRLLDRSAERVGPRHVVLAQAGELPRAHVHGGTAEERLVDGNLRRASGAARMPSGLGEALPERDRAGTSGSLTSSASPSKFTPASFAARCTLSRMARTGRGGWAAITVPGAAECRCRRFLVFSLARMFGARARLGARLPRQRVFRPLVKVSRTSRDAGSRLGRALLRAWLKPCRSGGWSGARRRCRGARRRGP